MGRYLRIGALAGAAGGAALALVLRLVGERTISAAIAIERARSAGGAEGDEPFGRTAQQWGGAGAAVIYGVALGAVLAVVFAAVRHRLGGGGDWLRSTRLATIAFVTLFLVPFLKYPANPPAVGDPATINRRTALYLLVVAWSVVSTWATWRAARFLEGRAVPEHRRVPAVAALYVAVVVVGLLGLPANTDPLTVPANLLWHFRLATVAGSAAFWSVTGAVFGWLCLRATAPPPESASLP